MIVFQGPTGVELVMHERPEEPGVHHILQDVAGWFGGVGVTGDNTQRSLSHGLFPQPSRRTGRALTVKGVLVFEDRDVRAVAERRISGLFWDGELGTVTVDDGNLVLSTEAKLDGEIDLERWGTTALRVSVPLLCPDPFLYAQAAQTSITPPGYGEGVRLASGPFEGDVFRFYGGPPPGGVLTNAGNVEAWPRFVVRGAFPSGFRIVSGRHVIAYPHPVYEQAPVTVDTRTGSVSVRGVDQTHLLSSRQWFSIPPHGSVTARIDPYAPSEGWMDAYTQDTYI